jgi:hypothetical protein
MKKVSMKKCKPKYQKNLFVPKISNRIFFAAAGAGGGAGAGGA